MKVTYMVGIGALLAGSVWTAKRFADRAKLKTLLEGSTTIKLAKAANVVFQIGGDKRFSSLEPEALSKRITVVNTVSPKDAFREIVESINLLAKDVPTAAAERIRAAAQVEAAVEAIPESLIPNMTTEEQKEAGEGWIPDDWPIIGSKEKLKEAAGWFWGDAGHYVG